MTAIGQIEKKTQERVVALFHDRLGYDYLGNWIDRPGNANIEPDLLRAWLQRQGVDDGLIGKVLHILTKGASDIRQNLDNQKKAFIQPFFSTLQWVMAGNDSEGLRYATLSTPEKYYLKWVEENGPHAGEPNLLDRNLLQICAKARFLELIHDFVVFDAGIKKLCRQNQYFGIKAAQGFIRRREGGIIWHTQGSGKSLTMVWLAKWILENRPESRVLIITDRTELDEQIEKVFIGVSEKIVRTKSGAGLVEILNDTKESLICSLVHKFGGKGNGEDDNGEDTKAFIESLQKLPPGFSAKGDLHVFVDECHRTQSGDLHDAMKAILPNALFIGFTGTPLLKADKKKSIEVFGRYIHTYKFDQAVREGVVLDLRYEARDIDQRLTNKDKIDQWFEAKTKGLNDLAKAQLKQKWGTMQRVLSSQDRLGKIVADILLDMNDKPRLMDGHGNAMLVAGIRIALMVAIPADQGLKAQQGDTSSPEPLDLETETDRILTLAKHQHGY